MQHMKIFENCQKKIIIINIYISQDFWQDFDNTRNAKKIYLKYICRIESQFLPKQLYIN